MILRTPLIAGCIALAAVLAVGQRLEDTERVPLDHKAIQYPDAPTSDTVARLKQRLDKGEVKLAYEAGGLGYLPSLLRLLDLNVDSQMLVFAQTSAQSARISPRRPRAIYFNDTVSVGFVQDGEVLELTSLDPKQGVILYTLDVEKRDKPEFARHEDCLQCHQGAHTLGVPGLVVSSQYRDPDDKAVLHGGSGYVTDDRTPLGVRWGGWYVTGTLGKQSHLGNMVTDTSSPDGAYIKDGLNRTSLADLFDTSRYLAPTSDVVALMTLEHQTRMTNLIVRLGWDTRIAMADEKLGQLKAALDLDVEDMVTYMLFANEAEIDEPIKGVSTFTKTFADRGPRDKMGRSLRDFDLQKRLFRYPLSYMIYSAAFDAMPDLARERVYQRLYDVLSGKDTDKKFARLSADDRRNILEIVRDTKTNLPSYWSASTK
jgi:hypothetical protein